MQMTKEDILSMIEQNKDTIKKFGVKKLILIGSYADDRPGNESDIDFIVHFKPGRGLFRDYTALLTFLRELFNKDIDLIKPNLIREEIKPYIDKKYEAKI